MATTPGNGVGVSIEVIFLTTVDTMHRAGHRPAGPGHALVWTFQAIHPNWAALNQQVVRIWRILVARDGIELLAAG
jgi:hypothetical protein